MDVFTGLVVLVVLAALYFLPFLIATQRKHHQQNSILILNFFLGWTFLGWVVALAMAVSHTDSVTPVSRSVAAKSARCSECGAPNLPTATRCERCGVQFSLT